MKSLKIVLWICALGCLTAVPLVILPWGIIENIMLCFGLEPIPDTPAAMYFVRVACGVFGLVGIFFIILARNPLDYGPMLNLCAYGLIVFGLLSLIIGLSLKMSPIVFLGDVIFGIILGILIAILSSKAQRAIKAKEETDING
ncbi:hypothetical protein ACFL5K_02300 [Gemmatimonadota bacterium]